METQLGDVAREAGERVEAARALAEAKTEEYVGAFREQLKAREEELINLEGVHSAVKAQYEKRVADLAAKVKALEEKLASVEARRALDMEGFTADVTYLRRSLAAVDRRVQQLKLVHRLDDDERLDALLDELERRAPDVEGPPDDGRSDAGSVTSALGGDLRGIRAALGGLQARLDTSRRKLPGRPAPPAPAASKAPGKAKRAAPKSAPPGGRKPAR
mmetsp:Transcript_37410/g.94558  ORF Transcript_37410/g.94558 Transcript_37410/m.94558 type:complete len:217 (+) Transcript_37410:428-1078(+)